MTSPAVLIVLHRRPQETRALLDRLEAVQPARLFVFGDGPRPAHPEEQHLCEQVRAEFQHREWTGEVHERWSAENLGIAKAIPEAINWMFENVDSGIILEDDCIPSVSFFEFAGALLESYREDERIGMISGYNFLGRYNHKKGSYFFSNFGSIWGWATWSRAWSYYDADMSKLSFPSTTKTLRSRLGFEALFRLRQCSQVSSGRVQSWAIPWGLARNLHGLLSIVPSHNLIENIGFGPPATNTISPRLSSAMPRELVPPYNPPNEVVANRYFDSRLFPIRFKLGTFWDFTLGKVGFFFNSTKD